MDISGAWKADKTAAGSLIYYNSFGPPMYCRDQREYENYKRIDQRLKNLWAPAEESQRRAGLLIGEDKASSNAEVLTATNVRDAHLAKTDNMNTMMTSVMATIGDAIKGLESIKSCCSCSQYWSAGISTDSRHRQLRGFPGAPEIYTGQDQVDELIPERWCELSPRRGV